MGNVFRYTACALVIVLMLAVAGSKGIYVTKCAVTTTKTGGVLFDAFLFDAAGGNFNKVYVHAEMGNENDEYVVGPLRPWIWSHREAVHTAQEVDSYPAAIRPPLSPISDCFVSAVEYQDGTFQVWYSPM
jgi:hypothetical protein